MAAKPAILAVDDEPPVLGAVSRDLRAKYGESYRVVRAGSGGEALDAVRQLKARGEPLALFLVDQRMPEMSGTEFLAEAIRLFPDSKKVLLTAYADTQAAIDSINRIGLDHYLMKPWDPPEERLYPVLDDLLDDWLASAPRPYDGVRVCGTLLSSASHDVKDFLARNAIPYKWVDLDHDPETRVLVESLSPGGVRLPVVLFPDGSHLVAPDPATLADKLAIRTQASQPVYDLAVVGAGPAGLAAAVYAASEGLRTLIVEKEASGGQAGTSSRIENYLGFPSGISGVDLARRAADQARRLGAEIVLAREVAGIRVEAPYKVLRLSDGREVRSLAVLVATGMSVRRLQVPGEERFHGAGVYYGAALTEAANFRGQRVLVVGGGNSAGQAAMWFSRYAERVYLAIRRDSLEDTMSKYLIDRLAETKNVELLPRTEVAEVSGEERLASAIVFDNRTGEKRSMDVAALIIFIGQRPHSAFLEGTVARDEKGFVLTGRELAGKVERPKGERDPFLFETSVPGIFAIGDVRAGSSKRVAGAVGDAAGAVPSVHAYLEEV